MRSNLKTELTLPNEPSLLPLVQELVRSHSAMAELAEDEAELLAAAAEEACRNILQHAFAPGDEGSYTVVAELTPSSVILSFQDQGLPFEPHEASARAASPPAGGSHGLHRIEQAVDEAHWINHGAAGKELRLVKHRPHDHVTEQTPAADLTPLKADEPLAPPQEYVIRRFQPEDAAGVARCVYRVYGYTYHHDELYQPERITRLNEEGKLVSVVAVDEAGEIVGHYALERHEMGPVAETGEAVVSPAHRSRGLMQRMRALIEEEARRLDLEGVYGSAVTTHPYSQKSDEAFGCHVCGVTLGLVPRTISFKKIASEPLAQRVSCVLYFKFLKPPARTPLFIPPRHLPVVRRIYDGLGVPLELGEAEPATGAGRVQVEYRPAYGVGMIRVREIGADTAAEVRRARRDLCEVSAAEAVYLEIPLGQAAAPDLCAAVESDGFFFSGMGPEFAADGDVLRLQFLQTEIDPDRLQLANPFSKELVDYALSERKRVQAP